MGEEFGGSYLPRLRSTYFETGVLLGGQTCSIFFYGRTDKY